MKMAITRLYRCKDFEPKWYWNGSRLANQPAGFYTVIWRGADGKQYKDMGCGFSTKREAQKYISATVSRLNAVLVKAHNQGIIHLESLRR